MSEEGWSAFVVGILVGLAIGIPAGWFSAQLLLHSSEAGHTTQYSNVEEWEIVKDESGRTRGIRVHRTAKEG